MTVLDSSADLRDLVPPIAVPARSWLITLTHPQAAVAVALGCVGVGALHRSQLDAMAPGDGLVCYCPPLVTAEGLEPRGFPALGLVAGTGSVVAPDARLGAFRRDVAFRDCAFVRLDDVGLQLQATRDSRRMPTAGAGIVPLPREDFALLAALMLPPAP